MQCFLRGRKPNKIVKMCEVENSASEISEPILMPYHSMLYAGREARVDSR